MASVFVATAGGAEDSMRVNPKNGFDLHAKVAVHVDGAVNRPDVKSHRSSWFASYSQR